MTAPTELSGEARECRGRALVTNAAPVTPTSGPESVAACVARIIDNGASLYVRERDLPKLFPRSVEWAEDEIIPKLEGALRKAQNAARRGHWAYDGNRTIAIRQALEAERREAE